ncbi:hypothetical protein ACHAWF_017969 [Thalassiosira exigua]
MGSRSDLPLKSVTAAATAVIIASLFYRQRHAIASSYQHYRGMRGLLRLVWLGDFLPSHLRQSMSDLDKVDERMKAAGEQLEQIEILVETVRLDSVDGSTTPDVTNDVDYDESRTELFRQYPELRTRIGIFSNKLDTLAAMIDSIKSYSDEEVKRRKKSLSNQIVDLMNDLDRMIASLNVEAKW